MKRKILTSSLLVCLLAFGLFFISCNSDNGTTSDGDTKGDGHTEIVNTFYVGRATLGELTGKYFYIGNLNISPSQDTPSGVFRMPGYTLIVGTDWDNTPNWNKYFEWIPSEYGIMKNGKLVSYSDLPNYSGSGDRNNRKQHFVFAVE